MKINKIEISNFYSIKNVKFSFDKHDGIVLIEGDNKDTGGSNGSGKSALIEAVVWGLFGKTIRKSTEEALINNKEKKNCSVKITVNDNLVIERGKKPVFLRLHKGDKEITRDNALNTQALIDELLETNYKVFLASTVFGQQNNIEFINATPEDKRTIIKNFLNLDELFSLRESVKRLKSEYSQTVKQQDAIAKEHTKSIESFDKQLSRLEKLRKDVEGKYDEETLSLSLQDVINLENENTSIDWRVAGINKEIGALEDKISHLSHKLEDPSKHEYCDMCGQVVDAPTHPKRISYEIEECRNYMTEYEEERALELQKIKPVPISSSEYHQVIEYNQLKKESETFEEIKNETLEKIQEAHDIKQEYNSKYEIMRFWEKAFSESGIVKYIIKNVLEYFNSKVNFYLSHLSQGKFFIEFDESLKESITHNKNNIHYMSLSGGEKRKISLSVMLGLQELLRISHNQKSNLMFFDEVAENLDQEGLEGLYILLSELKKEKTLFVITHNNYLKSLMDNARTITMIKSKGITRLKGK
jgi:DNA repair exonuclease SbcCD ATPase subunit